MADTNKVTVLDKKFEGEIDAKFPFELDDFQKHAYKLLQDDTPKNITVCCHTGSGKSMLIDFCILRAIKLNKRVAYCSPIKALSNQFFFGLGKKYQHVKFGLITGDHKINPDAQVVIITTEILCNMLIHNSLKINDTILEIDFNDFDSFIFDECHYINDDSRGKIWEQSIMMTPKHINKILLSATIDNPKKFCEWVHSCNGNPTYLLTNNRRVVPLNFNYSYFVNNKKLSKQMEPYQSRLNTFTYFTDTNINYIEKMHEVAITNLNKLFVDTKVNQTYIINEIVKELQNKNMLPALFFIFSKKRCLDLAQSITSNLNDYTEGVEVQRQFDYYLSKLDNKDAYLNSYQYHIIRDLAIKGIATHHSGLLPVFKEIIELLFSKNLIKLLFCTETIAIGINLPVRAVVFTDIYKYTEGGKRRLYPHEFIQMSGRAGRRGIDTIGYVILTPQLFSEETSVEDMRNLMFGGSQKITSKFNIDNELILQLIENIENKELEVENMNEYALEYIKNNIDKTLLKTEILDEVVIVEREKNKVKKELDEVKIVNKEIFEEYEDLMKKLNDPIQPSKNQLKKIELKVKEIKKNVDFQKEIGKYEKLTNLKNEYENLNKYNKQLDSYVENHISKKMEVLLEDKFIKIEDNKYKLDVKGKIARKIKEIDCVIGTEIFTSEFTDTLFTNKKIHKILALFTLMNEGRNNDYIEMDKEYHDIIKFIDNYSLPINREMVKPVLDWYDGLNSRQIVEMYEIQEGDLVKVVNKIIHVIDNVIDVYLMINKVENIEILNGIKEKINRDIMGMESLYLKLA